MSKHALITGIAGQDGIYLTRLLLEKDYKVFGLVRSLRNPWPEGMNELAKDVQFLTGDLYDFASLRQALRDAAPDEIYNLAAQSSVMKSWTEPLLTLETTGLGAVRLLEAVRLENPKARFFQASSSEMIGVGTALHNPLEGEYFPLSPYAASKLLAYHMTRLYREQYGLFTASAVLFNHESPYRTPEFVSRKISIAAAKASRGQLMKLPMGDIDVIRDWGFAGDYMEAAWKLMQLDKASDVVVATGVSHTIREMLEVAFRSVKLNYQDFIETDKKLFRVLDAKKTMGDPSRIQELLNWKPRVSFEQLIAMMVERDVERISKGLL